MFKLAVVLAFTFIAQACTSQQLYGSGQAWQRQECNKINDSQQRAKCMESAAKSHDEYQKEAAAAKGGK